MLLAHNFSVYLFLVIAFGFVNRTSFLQVQLEHIPSLDYLVSYALRSLTIWLSYLLEIILNDLWYMRV